MKNICITILCFFLAINSVSAQCPAPVGDSIFTSPAYCQGSGSVTVYSVSGGGPGNAYQYELRFDSVSNTSVAKPYQNDSIFTNVLRGRYKVNIRTVCPGVGVSAPFTSASVTVTGTATPLSISNVTVLSASACGNGKFTITATGGNTAAPYEYALVPAQGTPEPVAVYVRPKQSSNAFQNLAPGTYYVRVYDSCGTYATAGVVIDAVTEAVSLSSDRGGSSFYGCDSLRFRMAVTLNYREINSQQFPSERFWVTYAGITDTIPNLFFIYSASNGISTAAPIFKTFNPIAYPAVITYGFRSDCGNIYTKTDTVKPPVLKIDLISAAVSCTQRRYTIRAKDSLSIGWNYYNTRLSTDSGNTWSPLNTDYFYNDTFVVGQTYHLVLASGCDTDRLTVTAVAPAFGFQVNQFTAFSCNGNSGFGISVLNSQFSGNIDSIKFNVLSQPSGANLPDSFYYIQETGASGTGSGFRLSYDIPPGTYTLKGTDQCGATATRTIMIAPTQLQYTISPRLSCTPAQSGFTINIAQSNYQNYYANSYVRARITNTATSQVDSFTSPSPLRPASINVSGLVNGTYAIQVYHVRGPGYPSPVCTVDTVYANTVNQPLSLSQSYFTASCGNGTATVSAMALGGGGSYSYSLYKKNGSGIYVQDAGPQASGLFNNLLPSSDYQVRVTDTCGNGTQYATSFENVAPSIFLSTPAAPCPGDPVTFSVPAYPNATFSWLKNNNPIAAATTNSYTVNSVPASTVDTYKAVVSLGSCIIYTNAYILNPVNCGQPLPVSLTRFGGSFAASGQAVLQWQIANPDVAVQFVPEYSTDGKTFRQAGVVPADGSDTYQYQDIFRDNSRLYYRLKLLSKDGMPVYSGTIRMDKGQMEHEISVYPTIITSTAHIRYNTAMDEAVQWSLTDMQGRVLRSGSFQVNKGNSELNINGLDLLTPGIYLLQLRTDTRLRYQGKIVVNH